MRGILAIWAVAAAAAAAQGEVMRSPFMPPGNATAAAAQNDPNGIELRGIMTTPDGTRYNIYLPTKKTSVWVGVNETGYPFMVKSGDPEHDTAFVTLDGQQLKLELKKAKVLAGGGGGLPPGGVVLHPTSADEAVRLQAVAEEVRRRRLLREQATGPNGQPGNIPGIIQTGPGQRSRPQ